MPTPAKPQPTVAFVSLGCVKNLVDSEKMMGLLAEDGMLPHPDPQRADVLVVNTCAFIDDSKRESIQSVREALEWKAAAPGRRVVVAGCMAQRYGKQIADDLPGIDAMIGVFQREQIVEAARSALAKPDAPPADEKSADKAGKRRTVIPLPLRINREAEVGETDAGSSGAAAAARANGSSAPIAVTADDGRHLAWKTRSSVLLQQADSHPVPADPPSPAVTKSGTRKRGRDRTSTGFWLGGDPNRTDLDLARMRLTPPHYAYLRISEGCDKRCTFCIIPHIRGDLVSKSPDDVVAEARELVADGARELIVVGQNTTSYLKDRGEPDGIARLLRRLADETDVERLRLMYVYPANFTRTLIKAMAEVPEILPYVDMPLQHVNDRLLKEMKRGVSKARIESLLRDLRAGVPGVVVRTTFIVGFPGETEAEFREMVDFVREHGIERVGVFTYSPEEGTPAASLSDAVPDEVKQRRREELMLAAQEVAFAHVARQVGTRTDVTLDGRIEEPPEAVLKAWKKVAGRSGRGATGKAGGRTPSGKPSSRKSAAESEPWWWVGRTYGQAPEVDSVVYVRDAEGTLESGDCTPCVVRAGADYDLVAEPAGEQ